jgi:hypothetical protein
VSFDIDSVKVTEGHKSLAAYIKRETGKGVKPESIALIDALRVQYRKDPSRVAERDARAAAARARKEAAYQKALAKAQALAASLGLEVAGPSPEVARDHEPSTDEFEDATNEPEAEPEAEPAKKPSNVTPIKPKTPADEETLVPEIDVVEDYDGWETSPDEKSSGDSDDFFDEGEDY